MATIIDSLLVTLGLDSSNFSAGQKQASADLKRTRDDANVAAKAIEASGKRAAEFFKNLRNEAIALFAVFAGARGLSDLIRDITNTDAATGRLAHNLGMSTEDLAAWEGAAERAGGTAAATAGSLDSLTQQFQQFALTGQSAVIPYLRALGVDVADAQGKLRPLGDILLDLADKFKGMDPRRATALGRSLGLDQGTINLLEQGREAVQKLLEEQKKLGLPSDADAGRAQGLIKQFLDIRQGFESLTRTIINDLTPTVSRFLQLMDDWIQKNRDWLAAKISDEIKAIIDYVKNLDWNAALKQIKDVAFAVYDIVKQVAALIRTLSEFRPPAWVTAILTAKPPAWLRHLMQPGVDDDGNPDDTTQEGRASRSGFGLAQTIARALEIALNAQRLRQAVPGLFQPPPPVLSTWLDGAIAQTMRALLGIGGVGAGAGAARPAAYTYGDDGGGRRQGGVKGGHTPLSGLGGDGHGGSRLTLGQWLMGAIRGSMGGGGDLSGYSDTDADRAPARLPRGVRNNNPGNLRSWQGAGQSDGYAVFRTPEEGLAAMRQNLEAYYTRHGLDTLRGIIMRWAPPADHNNTEAYIAGVARSIGLDPNAHLNMRDPAVLAKVMRAMIRIEQGYNAYSSRQIAAAAGLGARSRTYAQTPAHPAADLHVGARAAAWHHTVNHNDNSSSVSMRDLHVHTAATDAAGIAGSMRHAIRNAALAQQWNYGLA